MNSRTDSPTSFLQNRFFASENSIQTWTTFIVRVTITSQFLIGMICSIPIPFYGYRYIIIDCIDVMVAQDPTGVIVSLKKKRLLT